MIILCTNGQVEKKCFKKVKKIVVSEAIEEVDRDDILFLNTFLPDFNLWSKFASGDIDKKQFKKKYMKDIVEDDDKFALLITIAAGYAKAGKLVFVCSEEEMSYWYLQFLAELLEKRYSIPFEYYYKFKKNDKEWETHISKKSLNADIKENRDILNVDVVKSYDKKKKKDKHKEKDNNKRPKFVFIKDKDKKKKKKEKECKIFNAKFI